MNYTQFGNTYLLKLDTHEEVIREIKKFCIDNNIKNATISAIGAINSITLGFWDNQKQEYYEQSMHRPFELSAVNGTLTSNTDNEEPNIHLHATICDKDFRTYGGHLFRAIVSKTVEITIFSLS